MTTSHDKKILNSGRLSGKRTIAINGFIDEGMKGKSIIYATLNGNFLSPKAVERLVEKVIKKEREDMQSVLDDDSCECDNCNRTRRYYRNPKKELHSIEHKINCALGQRNKEIMDMIEGMKMKETFTHEVQGELHDYHSISYNEALQDIINNINK